jgi:hypothetical protein
MRAKSRACPFVPLAALVIACSHHRESVWAPHYQPGPMSVMHAHRKDTVVTYADRCTRLIKDVDPQLDDPASIEKLYANAKFELPRKPKFKWIFLHLDLAIYESVQGTALIVQQGWN